MVLVQSTGTQPHQAINRNSRSAQERRHHTPTAEGEYEGDDGGGGGSGDDDGTTEFD